MQTHKLYGVTFCTNFLLMQKLKCENSGCHHFRVFDMNDILMEGFDLFCKLKLQRKNKEERSKHT